VRSLVTPKHHRDGREFLAQRLLAQGETLAAFGRPLQGLGLRLALPPTEQHRSGCQVRIENWAPDPRSVWIEVTTTAAGAIAQGQLPQVADHLYATYALVTGPVSEFLAAHDRP
jgi:hypothetical protein